MKLTQETSPVEIGGAVGKPSQFQIVASKEAFKILSSGLYNNKILAIIRELSCNAYDAHVAANKKDVPFEIHFPTVFEPQFSIKDYGVGLSHDEVLSLYTTYFATNKTQSNEFVGALGLGSKSPFCYTEGFSVTSRYNGTTRIYSCFLDENGMPSVLLQSEESTPEAPNGLEVSFPVKNSDVWEFENQAKKALKYFNPAPKINIGLEILETEYVIRTEKWGLRKEDVGYGYSTDRLRAIQGMVEYKVGNIDISRLSQNEKRIANLPLDLFFDIGDLSVAASRESLSNDERTIGNVVKALGGIRSTLLQSVKDKFKECKTFWEAKVMLFSLINTTGFGDIINEAFNKGEFNDACQGFELTPDTDDKLKINQLSYPNLDVYYFRSNYRTVNSSKSRMSKTKKEIEELMKYYSKPGDHHYDISFRVEKDAIFVVNDVGFGAEKYVHHFLQRADDNEEKGGSKIYKSVYFITRTDKKVPVDEVTKKWAKIFKELKQPPFKLLSELKNKYKLTPAPSEGPYVPKKLFTWDFNADVDYHREGGYSAVRWGYGWQDATEEIEDLPDGTKYYVPIKRLEPQVGEFAHAQSFAEFLAYVMNSKKFSITGRDTIYGVPENSPLLKEEGWVELVTLVWNELKAMMTPELEIKINYLRNQFMPNIGYFLKEIGETKPLDPNSEMQKFCDSLLEMSKCISTELGHLSNVVKYAESRNIIKLSHSIDFREKWEKIKELYPMVEYAKDHYYGERDKNKDILEYCKMVDKHRKYEIDESVKLLLLPSDIETEKEEVNVC